MHQAQNPEDAEYARLIASKVRSGEYFRDARAYYAQMVNDSIADRYFYLLIACLSLLSWVLGLIAASGLMPLSTSVPYPIYSQDIVEDYPRVRRLVTHVGQDPGEKLLYYFIENHVKLQEEYDFSALERTANGLRVQSSPGVFAQYQERMRPENPQSPIALYQRHTKRSVEIVSYKPVQNSEYDMEVRFNAALEREGEKKTSQWVANIAFSYSGLALDEETEKVKPVSFSVTGYRSQRMQEIQ